MSKFKNPKARKKDKVVIGKKIKKNLKYIKGIDLGTTNSCVAVWTESSVRKKKKNFFF